MTLRPLRASEHLHDVKYEIRGALARRAEQLEREGHEIVKLNIGNPGAFGFRMPGSMRVAVVENLHQADPYSHQKGIFPAREAVVMQQQNRGVMDVTADDVFIGNGVSELIMIAMRALLNPGDEVLVPSPDYPLWTASVVIHGARAVHYPCRPERGFVPDPAEIESLVTDRTRALVLINPNNPTGALYPREVLLEVVQVAREHDLIVFCDEIYDKTLYDDNTHTSVASLADDVLFVTFNGLSKNYRSCGFRAGWMVVSGDTSQARDYIEGLDMLASMRLCSNTELITAIPGVSCNKPQAALYMFPKLDPVMYPIADDRQFFMEVLKVTRVMLVQGSGFNYPDNQHFRIVFLPHEDDLREAIERLAKFLAQWRARHGN